MKWWYIFKGTASNDDDADDNDDDNDVDDDYNNDDDDDDDEEQEKQERIVPEWSRHWTLILDKKWDNHFFGQKLCCPPPTLPTKGGDHGAKKPTMVPTWCQPWCHGANQFSRHIRSFLEENIFW